MDDVKLYKEISSGITVAACKSSMGDWYNVLSPLYGYGMYLEEDFNAKFKELEQEK